MVALISKPVIVNATFSSFFFVPSPEYASTCGACLVYLKWYACALSYIMRVGGQCFIAKAEIC